jgi:hypothetical protein
MGKFKTLLSHQTLISWYRNIWEKRRNERGVLTVNRGNCFRTYSAQYLNKPITSWAGETCYQINSRILVSSAYLLLQLVFLFLELLSVFYLIVIVVPKEENYAAMFLFSQVFCSRFCCSLQTSFTSAHGIWRRVKITQTVMARKLWEKINLERD